MSDTATDKKTTASDDEWSPDRIKTLRADLDLSRADMGWILYGYTGQMARKSMYRLEKGKRSPNGAVKQTLRRLEAGRLDPETELDALSRLTE